MSLEDYENEFDYQSDEDYSDGDFEEDDELDFDADYIPTSPREASDTEEFEDFGYDDDEDSWVVLSPSEVNASSPVAFLKYWKNMKNVSVETDAILASALNGRDDIQVVLMQFCAETDEVVKRNVDSVNTPITRNPDLHIMGYAVVTKEKSIRGYIDYVPSVDIIHPEYKWPMFISQCEATFN